MTYFKEKISRGFISLYTGKTIILIGSGLLGIFLPIFLFELFDQSFIPVALFYGLSSVAYLFVLFFGARFLNNFGFRRALRTSVFLGAAFYVIFYFLNKGNISTLIPLAIIVLAVYRFLYWLPYHVDMAKFTSSGDRGKELSLVMGTKSILGALLPIVAGTIIVRFNFDMLFLIAIAIYLFSYAAYVKLPRTRERFGWSYGKTFRQFFSKEKRGVVLAFISKGAESSISIIVWPIFIFQIFKGDLFGVGAVSTLIIGVTIFLQLLVGKSVDESHEKEKKTMKIGSILYAIGWVLKIFVLTAFQVFVVGAYHSMVWIFARTPFFSFSYDLAADQGHYVDEFTVLYELAIHVGKVIAIVLMILLSLFFPIKWIFILGAIAALLLNLLWLGREDVHPQDVARFHQSH